MMTQVLVTNPRPQCDRLAAMLKAKGCAVTQLPLWEAGPPADGGTAWRSACGRLAEYDWVTFTSRFAVEAFVAGDARRAQSSTHVGQPGIAAVGAEMAAALRQAGFPVACVAEPETAEGLVATLVKRDIKGARVLAIQGNTARPTLVDGLRQAGARVDVVLAYTMQPVPIDPTAWLQEHADTPFDAVAFTAPSAVERFVELFGPPARPTQAPPEASPRREPLRRGEGPPPYATPFAEARWFAIGPTTAAALQHAGLTPIHQPRESTFAALSNTVSGT